MIRKRIEELEQKMKQILYKGVLTFDRTVDSITDEEIQALEDQGYTIILISYA